MEAERGDVRNLGDTRAHRPREADVRAVDARKQHRFHVELRAERARKFGVPLVAAGSDDHALVGFHEQVFAAAPGADADDALTVSDQLAHVHSGVQADSMIDRALDEVSRQPRAEAALVLHQPLGHRRVVPLEHVGRAALAVHLGVHHAVGHQRRDSRAFLPLAQRSRVERLDLKHPPFGQGIVAVHVIVVGTTADDLHPEADPLLEPAQRGGSVIAETADHRVLAIVQREPLQVAEAALGRILDADCGREMIARHPALADRQRGDAAQLVGFFQH
jgi:hypothetical protein